MSPPSLVSYNNHGPVLDNGTCVKVSHRAVLSRRVRGSLLDPDPPATRDCGATPQPSAQNSRGLQTASAEESQSRIPSSCLGSLAIPEGIPSHPIPSHPIPSYTRRSSMADPEQPAAAPDVELSGTDVTSSGRMILGGTHGRPQARTAKHPQNGVSWREPHPDLSQADAKHCLQQEYHIRWRDSDSRACDLAWLARGPKLPTFQRVG
ncbi:uncharacterized protein PG998_013870 [Apiospora kogelbergensis]|uniref:uncharacterized protein n=1 Tax=Apiospora kogelbergensis TaxID=1337665 RepID=UPI00312D49FF